MVICLYHRRPGRSTKIIHCHENPAPRPPFRRRIHPRQPAARALPQPALALVHRVCRLQPAAVVVHEFLPAGNCAEKNGCWQGLRRRREKVRRFVLLVIPLRHAMKRLLLSTLVAATPFLSSCHKASEQNQPELPIATVRAEVVERKSRAATEDVVGTVRSEEHTSELQSL